MKKIIYSFNYLFTGVIAVMLFSSVSILAQTASTATSGSSPLLRVSGVNYQAYCVEYTNGAPVSGHGYNWDTTPEDITNVNITACLNGVSDYGVAAVQSAIWYYTDNVQPSSNSVTWQVINRVENGTYQPTCASEWYPNDVIYQDLMTGDDPHCTGGEVCTADIRVTNNGCCVVDVYHWKTNGDVKLGTVNPGQNITVHIPKGDKIRVRDQDSPWNNLIFDEHYMANSCGSQTFTVNPNFCDKAVTVNNNGCCDIDLYHWGTGVNDVLIGSVAPGGSTTVHVPSGDKVRALNKNVDWNNKLFDEDYMVPNGCGPFTFTVNPEYCAEIICPADIVIECTESSDPSNTGNASSNCGNTAITYIDVVTGNCPLTIERTWSLNGVSGGNTSGGSNTTCEDVAIVNYSMEQCNADNNYNSMGEFHPTYPDNGGCSSVSASIISTQNGSHSCVAGAVGQYGFCIDADDDCWYADDLNGVDADDDKVRFEVTVAASQNAPFQLSRLSFYEKAPLTVEWDNNSNNDYPTKYAVKVFANGTEVFFQDEISTTNAWSLETFNFSNISVTSNTTFTFELHAYCKAHNYNNGGYELWDLDELSVYGGCCSTTTNPSTGDVSCVQIITIDDTQNPTFNNLPSNLTVECDNIPAAPVVTGSDLCDNNVDVTFTQTDDQGTNGCTQFEYTITRTWVATDDCGNSISATRTVTIEDNSAPTITVDAADLTVECDGQGNNNAFQNWLNNYGGAEANDNCGTFTWSFNPDPAILTNECGETGGLSVTFTATDECGNSASTTASFTIDDSESPVITQANQADDLTVECDGFGNTAALDAWVASNGGANATDVCGEVTWTNDFIALDPECCETGDVTVNFTATDDCGNSTVTTATFIIEDTTPPVAVCKDITVQIVDVVSHTVSITPDMIENGSSDVCCDDELTYTLSQSTFAFEEVGVNPITLTVTDACGNEATCNANVTVVCYDLALIKNLAAGQNETIFPEQDVTFTITVLNQGTIEANNIVVTDYIPSGLTLNDADWSLSGNTASYNVPGTLNPGQSATVDITFTADSQLTNDQQIVNRAEISSSDAPAPFVPVDEDSTADSDAGNDAGGEVNGNTDDTVNNENGDEDDSDPEDVTVSTMSIGSTVFIDNNNNGIQDLGDDDTGIAGVTLELWRDGALVATTVTDANGDYLFDDLAPGNYIVEIKEDGNFGDADPLAELHLSSEPTDNEDNQQDGDDNGMQVGGSGTEVKSPVIVLSPNDEPTNESAQGGNQDAGNDDNGDMTVDFGFVPEFSIGSNVFVDSNNNGTRDAGEEGIEGILVEIFSVGPDGIAENGDDVKVGEDTTDANGDYFVGWLKPGDFYGKIMNVSDDYPVSSTNIASSEDPNNDTDGDDNGLQPDGRGAGVWSNVITLSANDEPTNEPGSGGDQDDSLDDDNGNMTLDFGFIPQLSIGSNVFVDANDNGTRDADEDGIEGILVEIFSVGPDGIAENGDDVKVGEDVTDANGDYFVDGLLEGDYYAKIMDVSDDYPKSSTNIASSEDPNNDTDGDDNGLQADGPGSAVWSNVVTLSVNDEPTNEAGSGGDQDSLDDDNGNMTLDFGFAPQLSIGSNVFYDANDNGTRDADEDGIEGVTVEVFNTGADGIAENGDDELVGSDVTDANGDYFVDGLLEGDYYVKIMDVDADYPLSSGDTATSADPNNNVDNDDNGLQPDGAGAGVWSNVITLSINDEPTNEDGSGGDQDASDDDNGNMTVDFGFRPELSIGSNVYSDTNNNGVRDAGEDGIEGITVEVFNTGADGIAENADDILVGSDVTDANGDYFVGGLLEGDYYAKIMNVDAANPTSSTNIASSTDPNNDTDGDDNGLQTDGSGTGVWSNVITLSINDEPTNEAGSGGDQDAADDNNGNMTLDFGFNLFDLALTKKLEASEDTRVYPGEDITFSIEVFNQGNVDAYNVLVTDYIPAGLTLNDGAWAQSGSNATATIAGPIAAGSSEIITITLTVTTTDAGDLVNSAEITSAEDVNGNSPEDVDSIADDTDGNDDGGEVNGPTDDTVNNENGDEDDQDPEDITVEIFDLALIKTLGAGEDDRLYPGETITFDIEVFNQGTVTAQNIVIEDYAPAGLTATGATTLTIAGPLAPGASQTISIEFTADASNVGGQLINVAEIASAEDELGDNPTDLDSTPDTDAGNDAGGEVNGATDDTVNNEGGDEDDSDPEDVFLEIFDLALTKKLAAGEDARVYPGESVTFDIEVINQGTVPASNIVVEDFGAAGLTNNGSSTLTIAGPLAPGASEIVQVTFTVDADAAAGISTNIAEIQNAEDDLGNEPNDNDSEGDSDPNNDPTENDAVDGENGDEDDNDVEDVDIQIFDLALRKTLAAGEDARVYPGETITFTIEVFNQGTVTASNIVVEDYVPAGLTATGATTLTIAGPIAPGASESVDVEFTVTTSVAGTLENGAEIQSAEDDLGENPDDIDSTPDADDANDPTDDNAIDGENGDEDDDDIEPIEVEIFDIASNITLAPGEDDRVYPGETVSFKVTVFNQGTVTAQNIDVTLMIPDGLVSVDGIANMETITFAAPLAPGEMAMQILDFVVSDEITSAGELIIKEEISSAEDELGDNPTDIDSTPDEDFTNDAGGVVDTATDDTVDNEGGDEDDNDPENVFVEIFDLALIKTLSAGEDARVYPGETVSFDITVTNQGSVPASDILITDYVPAGLTANGSSAITIAGPLAPGASEVVSIEFTVDAATTGASLVNRAEITDYRDDLDEQPEDIDSVADADDSNDTEVNDEINNAGGDEDDADLEELELEIFDLALTKKLAAGEDVRVYPGETITFTIEVLNQGTVAASNVVIEDYVPAGLTATGATSLTIAGPIAPGASESVDISFTVSTTDAGTLENGAEIQSAEDDLGENPEDNDSTADNDPDNDPTTDDAVDNENGDEDDNDIEPIEVEVFDLASNITLAPGEDDRVYPGETVSFKVTVFNQGTVSAENIDVTLMIPDGLTSVDGIANMGTITFDGPLAPGEMTMQILEFVVGDDITSAGELIIKEEITSAQDEFGNNPTDIDSTPDADFTNDAGGVVDTDTDDTVDNENGDEDDNDPENVFVEIFDLALVKTLAAGEDARVYPGDAVTFDITVTNQGSVPATNVVIEDYVPAGLTATSPTTITLTQLLQPGESATVQVSFTVDAATTAGDIVNRAEISSANDDLGGSPEDIDSTPDTDDTNDTEVNDEINNAGGDEDDADLESLELEVFDLALTKKLAAGEDVRVYPGETITFTIEVTNQGSVPASNVVIEDYVPAGLTANGATSLTIAGPIAPGASESVDISFTVSTTEAGSLENGAEIQSAEDDLGDNPDDNDSTADSDPTNDPTTDDAVDNENGDEDDADVETIEVEVFDLASTITLAPGEDDRVYPGETVSFKVTVFNQGTVSAEAIDVTLMIPAGLTSVDGIANMGTITFDGPLAPGEMTMQILEFTVNADATSAEELIIKSEISAATDEFGDTPTDIDSTPDADFTNDAGGVVDSDTDDTILNENGDEDDNDPENVFLEIFDLALTKTTTQTEIVKPGDDVTYTITVLNQGSVLAQNITIVDYLPEFFALSGSDTNGWSTGGGTLSNSIAGPLAPGASTTVDVVLTVQEGIMSGTADNFAEITAAEDENGDSPADVDSTPDADNTNDTLVDNEVNNAGGDEDDHDIETVEVCDGVAPVLAGVPTDILIECSDELPALPVIGVEITATDFSDDDFTITVEETSTQGEGDDCSEFEYVITRTWTVVDECDNSSAATQVITIQDTTAPAITTDATDSVEECDGQGNVAAYQAWLASNGGAIAEDNCSDVTWTNDAGQLSDECGMTGSVSVVFTAEDVCGNTSVTSATFTIEDTTAPTIDLAAADEVVECDGQGNVAAYQAWLASNGGATASDICSDNNITWTNDAGQLSDECGETGSVSVIFTATDDCGNTATATATFTIEDTTAPVITADAADQTVECDGADNTAALQAWLASNAGAQAEDVCGGVTWTNDAGQLSDECGSTGFVTVNFTATDDCGNTAITSATFTIEDTTAPVIGTSATDETVQCDGDDNTAALQAWLASNGGADASDTCSDITWTNDAGQLSDECGSTGFVTVNFTATDDCGNTANTSATFTIIDETAPVIDTDASDMTVECDGNDNTAAYQAWLASNAGAVASDVCGEVTWSNDAGQLSDECGATGFVSVTFTATDDCGNTASTNATFTIEDTTAPVIAVDAADTVVECDGQGNAAALQAWIASNGGAQAEDSCGDVTWTNDAGQLSDECGSTGFVSVTFTATDDCGNTASTSATFTIEDTTAPVITAAATDDTVECDGQGNVAALQAWIASNGGAQAEDACGNVTWTNDAGQLSDECGSTGFVTVNFVATDDCGNTANTSATFTIEDTTAPDITVEADDLTVECDGQGNVAALQAWLAANGGANAVDGCSDVSWTNNFNVTNDDCGASGAATVTFTATDECGNIATTTASFVIEDTVAPTISGIPADLEVECDEVPPVALPVATDVCDDEVSIQMSEVTEAGSCPNSYVIIRTFTATDDCGNSAIATQTINVGDTGAPTLSGVPSDIEVECDAIPNFPSIGEVSATDNCDPDVSIETEEVIEAGQCQENYTIVRRWTATDNCGNATVEEQRIEVGDNTAPVLAGIPANISVECDAVPNTTGAGNVSASDNCDADVDISYEEIREDNGACEDAYTIVRTWIATDNCGNAVSGEQRIEVGDNTAPTLVGVPSDLEVECDDVPSATNGNIIATDNCDSNVEITFEEVREDNGACEDAYTIVRTWIATDNCGNATTDVQRITVGDNTAPVIAGIPASLTIECDEVDSATAGNIQATDNCDADVEITFEEVREDNGACEDAYTIVRTWTATDNCGNASSGEQRIQVGDNTDPVLTGVPADIAVECDAIPTTDANVQASDNCDANVDISFNEVVDAGSCDNSYVIIKTWTATDNCGNATSQQQRISVGDNTAPVIVGVPADLNAECGEVPNSNGANDVSVTDNCDANPLVEFSEVTEQNDACADAYVLVRTWIATDACGNATTAEQRITVGDNTAPVLVGIPNDATVECDAIATPDNGGVTAMDNCDANVSIEFAESNEPGICANSYTLVRTWIATDNCGNTAIGTQRISVGDNTPPVISGVDADLTIECGATPPAASTAIATDNCDANVQVELSEVTGNVTDCTSSYTITRTYIATDDCGNTAQAQQVITVTGDNTNPTLVGVPSNVDYECQDGNIDNVANVTATDNCDPNVDISFDEIITPGACAGAYTITRTWIATDDCGNTAIGTQTITVSDAVAPTLAGVPANVLLDCGDALPQPANVTASDNCDTNVEVTYNEVIDGAVDCQNSYTVVRTWIATDACGNESVGTQTITITGDNTAPTLVGVPNDVTFGCASVQDVPQGLVTATDNCDANVDIDFTEFQEAGSCPQEYIVTRTWIAIDDCGNSAVGVQRVFIGDSAPPLLVGVPNDVSIECGQDSPEIPTVTALDDCSANVQVEYSESAANDNTDCTASFQIIRTWTATDECGNVATSTQTISIGGDNSLPTLVGVPANMDISCDEVANIPNPSVTATDDCDADVNISLDEVVNAGNCNGSYQIVKTWTATDDCGNSAVATQTINVGDIVAPVISGVPGDITLDCGQTPSENMPDVIATDNCDADVSILFDEVRTEGDCNNTYTLVRTWTATDDCGNVSTVSQTVSVGDNEGPIFSERPDDLLISCEELIDIRVLTATDNCGEATVTFDDVVSDGNCAFNSTITRTYTATDECGNVSTMVQNIIVSDSEAPTCVGVPSDITVDATAGQSIPNVANVIATDNCDPNPSVEFTTSQTDGCTYIITRSWTVTDACGNANTCTQNITVIDELDAWLEYTRDENCDDENGAAVFAPSSYDYQWSDGGSGAVREDLANGTYTVTSTDASGCSVVITVVIGEIGNCGECVEPVVNIVNLEDATCGNANGSITLEIPNAANFTYTWIPNIGEGNANVRTGLPGGSYEVVISDLDFVNCFTKVNFVIGNSDGPDVTDIQVVPATCGESNGSVTLAPADFMYMWSIDQFVGNSRSDLAPGLYEIAVMDLNNPSCPSVIMVEVTGSSDLDASANILEQPTCGEANGSVQIAVQNGSAAGLSYAWNDGATGDRRDNLSAGTYTVVISDANGCEETLMFILMNDVAGANIAGADDIEVCFNGEATVDFTVTTEAGFVGQPIVTIVDENGVNAVNGNLTAGNYCIMVADANGCIAGQSCFQVNELPILVASATAQAVTCNENGSIDLTVSGGATPYTISWSNGSTSEDLTDLAAAQYTAQITDANGCVEMVVIAVADDCDNMGNDCELEATVSISAQPTCDNADGAATITIVSGTASTVAWPDGSSDLVRTDLAEGAYAVTITDASVANCVTTVSVILSDDADCDGTGGGCDLSASIAVDAQPTCDNADGAVTVSISAGTASTIAWSDGSSDLVRTGLAEGTYTVTLTDATVANCTEVLTVTLSDDEDCNGIGCEGSYTELDSDCEGNSGFICLDIPKSMYNDYGVAVNGVVLQEASVLACNFMTIINYDYSVLLDGGFKGPYEIQSWVVNGTIYSGTFDDVLEILDFMNDVDPTGNWMIDRTGQRIIGGNPDNNYGDFFIDQLAALNSQVEMGVNRGSIAMGTAIGPFDDGVYSITIIEPNATCPDTIQLTVTCVTDTTMNNVITDAIIVNTTVGTSVDVCTDITALSNVASMTLCGGPQGGSFTELANGCFTYTPGAGLAAGDSDQLCVTVCDDNGVCVETTVSINILEDNQMPCENGLDVLGDDLTLMTDDCDNGAALCTAIEIAEFNNYNFYLNGTEVTTMSTCDVDTVFNYSYFNIAQDGFNGTFSIDAWEVDGQTYTGSFTNAAELAAFLNANDATGNWILDENRLAIYGGDLSKSYGMIDVSLASTGMNYELVLNSEIAPNFVAFDLPVGTHTIIASDVTFGCADTLNITVECEQDPLSTPSWMDTVNIVIELGSDTLFCYPLTDIASVEYTCAADNAGSSSFEVVNNCIIITGDILGTDIGCFTICDTNGDCGMLIINTEVMTEGQMAPPVAMDDDSMTVVNVTIGTLNVLINDLNINETVQVSLVSQPTFGTVILNADNTFTYIPNPNTCGEQDEFQYMISTPMGSDIATVYIDILCEDLTVMNGFSPNGDDINETFTVLGLERYPNNEVIIFNRWGNQVYFKQGYTNADGWSGTWEGQDLPDGTYFYIINTGEGEAVSGYVQIQR